MKRLLLTLVMVLLVIVGFSQATPHPSYRIADATTAFGVKLPLGTIVYQIDADQYYVATAAIAETATVTTAAASLSKINRWYNSSGVTVNKDDADVKMTNNVIMTDLTNDATPDSVITIIAGQLYRASIAALLGADTTLWELNGLAIQNKSDKDVRMTDAVYMVDLVNDASPDSILTLVNGEVRRASIGDLGGGTVTQINEGNGISLSPDPITTTGTVSLGTPSTITSSSTNSVGTETHNHALDVGIADNDVVMIDDVDAASGQFAKFTTTGIEGATLASMGVYTTLAHYDIVAANDLTPPYTVTVANTIANVTSMTVQLNGQPLKYAASGTEIGTFTASGTSVNLYYPVYQYDRVEIQYQY